MPWASLKKSSDEGKDYEQKEYAAVADAFGGGGNITFLEHYTVFEKLVSLLVVLVIFLMLGNVLKWTLDYFDRQNEEKLKAEGEVIEKELEEELESEGAEGESA